MTDFEEALTVYFSAYQRGDIDEIIDWFLLPCHFVSDADEVVLMPLATREACLAGVERVVNWHRSLGVKGRRIVKQLVIELSPRISCVDVKVDVELEGAVKLYDFEAVYTFVRSEENWRIAAIAHNQIPRLLACARAQEEAAAANRK
jgi:hypothetical protein